MTSAWWSEAEARRVGGAITDFDLTNEIEAYNHVDDRALAEILEDLRHSD